MMSFERVTSSVQLPAQTPSPAFLKGNSSFRKYNFPMIPMSDCQLNGWSIGRSPCHNFLFCHQVIYKVSTLLKAKHFKRSYSVFRSILASCSFPYVLLTSIPVLYDCSLSAFRSPEHLF